jgi:hypothetical protein
MDVVSGGGCQRKKPPDSTEGFIPLPLARASTYSMSHPSGASSGTMISSVGVPLGTMKVARITVFLLLTLRNK